MNLKTMFLVGVAVMLSGSAAIVCAEEGAPKPAGVEDANGNLRVPADYRDAYEYLGTWSVANDDKPGAKQLHVVYASPGSVRLSKTRGNFPTGPYW